MTNEFYINEDPNDAQLEERQQVKGTSVMVNGRPKDAPRHRITVQANIYHQQNRGDATHIDGSYWKELVNDEQPWQRVMRLGQDPIAIPTGWIGEQGMAVSMIIIEILDKSQDIQVNVQFKGSDCELVIFGGQFQQFCPTDLSQVTIVASQPSVKIKITVIPA